MELLTDLVRLALVIVCLAAFVAIGVWFLFALSDADDTARRIVADVYDWDAERDFADPAHNPFMVITNRTVAVRCSCGEYTHVEPILVTTRSAYRAAEDEFWATHHEEVAA
jgi:hypothetical protein